MKEDTDKLYVMGWLDYSEPYYEYVMNQVPVSIGNTLLYGGWFEKGYRWIDYISRLTEKEFKYAQALFDDISSSKKNRKNKFAVFSDGTIGIIEGRCLADLVSAVMSEFENKDYCYLDFYDC